MADYPSPWLLRPKGLSQRTAAETAHAKSKAEDAKNHARLRAALKLPGNRECADCTCKFPGWGVLPHGVFVCINCAQAHRHIGRHISQTKGITTNTYMWYPDEVELMETVGNSRANTVYMARGGGGMLKPQEDADFETRVRYVREKYEQQKFLSRAADSRLSGAADGRVSAAPATPATPAATASAVAAPRRASIGSLSSSLSTLSSTSKTTPMAPLLARTYATGSCHAEAAQTTPSRDLIDLSDWEGFLNSK